ncbi:MAG: transglycosylase domain-containing protein, partial [Bryobacteraceae bacterium]
MTYRVAPGPSASIAFPHSGPYDERLGYSMLPRFLNQIEGAGFFVERQARDSKFSTAAASLGFYPIYREKAQAGLEISGRNGETLYSFRDPQRVYANFNSIPPIVVRTLLFIENRHMLDATKPFHNPAIEWGRLAHASMDFGLHEVDRRRAVIGGSTLATQLEKMRHSPQGRTHSPVEKLRQITSASLRIYRDGPRTIPAQRIVIRDYINSIPLSAVPSQGEVTGLGDGLAVWCGADFGEVNRLLRASDEETLSAREMNQRAHAYREVLSLFLALREPSRYLVRNPSALASQTDRYLRALYEGGVISIRLRDAALTQQVALQPMIKSSPRRNFVANKAPEAIRMRLLRLLHLPQTYLLDRLDLNVQATIDKSVQQSTTLFLQQIADPQQARNAGLVGYQLLSGRDPANVTYSFTLYERGDRVNLLRIQTDNFNQPLNINSGTRLQLGSTAKLRTLINYLQIVEQLHTTYAGLTPAQLTAVNLLPGDRLTA